MLEQRGAQHPEGDIRAGLVADEDAVHPSLKSSLRPGAPTRKFRLYCVGAGRAGDGLLREAFKDHRVLRDFQEDRAETLIARRAAGRLSDAALCRYIRRRDRDGLLEADIGQFHAGWIDLLPRLYPDALFLLTIRDSYAWLDATLNQLLEAAGERRTRSHLARVRAPRGGGTLREVLSSPDALVRRFFDVADAYLADWTRTNERLLAHIPRDRLLVLPLKELSDARPRLPGLARFLGLAPDGLSLDFGKTTAPPVKHGVLARVDGKRLETVCRLRCGKLMSRFFPGYTLRTFLARS